MGRHESMSPSSVKSQNTESGKSALVEFGHNLWNSLTGQHQQEKAALGNRFNQEKTPFIKSSRNAQRGLTSSLSINKYSAGEKMSSAETAQKIQNIFGDVSRVKIPRSNGRLEVATRRSDGLFYFDGKNTPCYLDKGETVSKDVETRSVQEVQKRTQKNFNNILPWNWFKGGNKSQEVTDKFEADSIEATKNLSGAAKKVVGLALEWAKSGAVKGAAHCTDWVDRVFKNATGGSVHGSEKCIYNKVGKYSGGTGLTGQPASREVISQIRPGDHLIVQWKPGRTHSAIAVGEPDNGIITVASWPGSGSSKIETYDLYGLGRAKNVAGGVLRIQRPGYSGGPVLA